MTEQSGASAAASAPKINASINGHPVEAKVVPISEGRRNRSSTRFNWSPREMFGRFFGNFGEKRDYYKVFGWDWLVTPQQMYRMYSRGGIAKRIVDAYPEATWAYPPEIVGGTNAFKTAFNTIAQSQDIWSAFFKWDKLSRLGRYSILLVGTDGGTNMNTPLTKASKILYLQPYSETAAKITQWNQDPTSSNFGKPSQYTIYPDLLENANKPQGLASWGFPSRRSFTVDASRVIHVAQGTLEDDVFGTPFLLAGWNLLQDLSKVVGGSAESYWLTANRGLQFDLDKEMDLDAADEASLEAEIDEYSDQQRRVIRTRGVTIKDLGSKVADPRGPYGVILQLLSGVYSIPTRVLVGSESGHLASTQDAAAWAQAIEVYRTLIGQPRFLIPFIQFLMNVGILPEVKIEKLTFNWPPAYRPSPLEKAQTANQTSTAAMNIALALSKVENLLSVEEGRRIIGNASDQAIFAKGPDNFDGTKAEVIQPPPSNFGSGGSGMPLKTVPGGGSKAPASGNTADSNGSGAASGRSKAAK